jgi:hypothetical protein
MEGIYIADETARTTRKRIRAMKYLLDFAYFVKRVKGATILAGARLLSCSFVCLLCSIPVV